jgi:lysozyme family protein
MAVNAGPDTLVKLLQSALGVTVDGQVGPKTLAAITEQDAGKLINRVSLGQGAYYRSLPSGTFGAGWLARCEARRMAALTVAVEPAGSVPAPSGGPISAPASTSILDRLAGVWGRV